MKYLFFLIILIGALGLSERVFSAEKEIQQRANAIAIIPFQSQATSVIERIRARDNTLVAGVWYDFEPFGFIDGQGNITGFEVELVQAMVDLWGIEVEFVPVTASDQIQKLMVGNVDIIVSSLTHTKEADNKIDFSQTYFLDGQSLVVVEESDVQTIQDLHGKTVATVKGSTGMVYLQNYLKSDNADLNILPFQEYSPAVSALRAGQIDALIATRGFLVHVAQKYPDLRVLNARFTHEPFAIGIPSNDSTFRNFVDLTLQQLKINGVYDSLHTRWFPQDQYPDRSPHSIQHLDGNWINLFDPAEDTDPSALETDSVSAFDTSSMEQIIRRGRLLIGVMYDLAPFGYVDEAQAVTSAEVIGFDIDIAREFARRWLGDESAVELVRVTTDTRIPMLKAGAIDLVIAFMTQSMTQEAQIDFSQTYFEDQQALLVRTGSNITTIDDLHDKLIAAVYNSSASRNIRAKAIELNIPIEILPFQEHSAALQALNARQVEAVTAPMTVLTAFADAHSNLRVIPVEFAPMYFSVGVANHRSQLRDLVNFTLQDMQIDGTYDKLYTKWIGGTSPYPLEIWPRLANLNINRPSSTTNVDSGSSIVVSTQTSALQPTATPTHTKLSSDQPDNIPTSTSTDTPTALPTHTVTATKTERPTATSTIVPSKTLTTLPIPLRTKTPTSTQVTSVNVTSTPSLTQSPTVTPTTRPTRTQTATKTPSPTPSPTATQTTVPTGTPTATMSPTAIPTSTSTTEPTATPILVPTATFTPLPTSTPVSEFLAIHTIVPGDTLSRLALQYYGNLGLWRIIYEENKQLIGPDPNALTVGLELKIPKLP